MSYFKRVEHKQPPLQLFGGSHASIMTIRPAGRNSLQSFQNIVNLNHSAEWLSDRPSDAVIQLVNSQHYESPDRHSSMSFETVSCPRPPLALPPSRGVNVIRNDTIPSFHAVRSLELFMNFHRFGTHGAARYLILVTWGERTPKRRCNRVELSGATNTKGC